MALVFADRVGETTETTGTGTYSLGGALTAFQTFVAGIGSTNTCYYMVTNEPSGGSDWEVGLGTVTDSTPDTLSRDTILDSSNSGSAVNWGSGTKIVLNVNPALRVSAPGKTLIEESDSSSVSSVSFTTGIDDPDAAYELEIVRMTVSVDQIQPYLLLRNGESFQTTNYQSYSVTHSYNYNTDGDTSETAAINLITDSATYNMGNGSGISLSGTLLFHHLSSTALYATARGETISFASNGSSVLTEIMGAWVGNLDGCDGIQIAVPSGTMDILARLWKLPKE